MDSRIHPRATQPGPLPLPQFSVKLCDRTLTPPGQVLQGSVLFKSETTLYLALIIVPELSSQKHPSAYVGGPTCHSTILGTLWRGLVVSIGGRLVVNLKLVVLSVAGWA